MIRFRLALSALLASALPAAAHDIITTKVTWSREIARVFQKRCWSCHGGGGSAFALETYEQSRPWAKAIKEEALERRMPPWGAVKGFGEFRGETALSQEEIELIADWVEGGAPQGDPALLPKANIPPAPAPPSISGELALTGSLVLKQTVRVVGIRPGSLADGTSLQITAQRPGGSLEPLLWLRDFKPAFRHDYFFRKALLFPAGTIIRCSANGAVSLLISTPKPGS